MVTQPLIERRDYGSGEDQLERNFKVIELTDPTLISDEQKRNFKERVDKIANQILNNEMTEAIVSKIVLKSGRL